MSRKKFSKEFKLKLLKELILRDVYLKAIHLYLVLVI